MSVEIAEPETFPSDDPANVEKKEHRKAYLVSFDPSLLADRIVLLEERVWQAQRAMTILLDSTPRKGRNEKDTETQVDKCITK